MRWSGGVRFITFPVADTSVIADRLATTLAPLRGPRTDTGTALAPLPVRVAPAGNGTFEVLGGWQTSLALMTRYARMQPDHLRAAVERLVQPSARLDPEPSRSGIWS